MNASRSHHSQSNQKLSLAERAAALKASVARMVRPQRTHQPSPETLLEGPTVEGMGRGFPALDPRTHDLLRGRPSDSTRNGAAEGDRPRQETDMGRHESFQNATPISGASFAPKGAGSWPLPSDPGWYDDAVSSSLAIKPSPALVGMIAEFQAVSAHLNGRNGLSDAEAEPFHERALALQMDIYRFPAGSVADLLAKVPVFQDELDDAVHGLTDEHRPEDTLAGAAWLGLFRDFRRLAEPTVAIGTTIEECRSEPSDLARACIDQVDRLDWLDDPNKPDMDDDALDAELDRWGEISTRAINEPSTNAFDLAAKARLAFADLDRFHPLERCNSKDWLLFRAIMHDAIALGSNEQTQHHGVPHREAQTLVFAIEQAWSDWSTAHDADRFDRSAAAEARYEARCQRRDSLIDAAVALPATSPDARHAKALALAWMDFVVHWRAGAKRSDYSAAGLLAIDIDAALASGVSA